MFPPSFAHDAVCGLTRPGEAVLDPFCGRGNGPYVATVSGRPSLGVDINPIAWLFTAVKLFPEPHPSRVFARLEDLRRARRPSDRKARSDFERSAWAPSVRSLLRAARRELDWKNSVTDRTLMGFVALHMQDKLGDGLSNSLWPTIACSPRYAVSWWTKHGLLTPPDIDPVALLRDKVRRRYLYGTPRQTAGIARLGDARRALRAEWDHKATLLLTSPPYSGVTDYWNDHWIRLWVLGHSMQKDWSRSARFANLGEYRELITAVLTASKRHLAPRATILIRSDARRHTWQACLDAIKAVWPEEPVFVRGTVARHNGASINHSPTGRTANEIDFIVGSHRGADWAIERRFSLQDAPSPRSAPHAPPCTRRSQRDDRYG